MVKFPSEFSGQELTERWDEYTSPARFAGSDDRMDLIFVSKRKDNKVRLVRRARHAFEPFSTVFRGKIVSDEKGSEIIGSFTKSIFDYSIVALILALLFYIRAIVIERGENLATINGLLLIGIIGSLILLYNRRSEKRKYAELIFRITGTEIPIFLSKKDMNDNSKDIR